MSAEHFPDIDIDISDRNLILEKVKYIQASKIESNNIIPHNVGVYFQDIPQDPLTKMSSIDYNIAEDYGFMKVDFLNLDIYKNIESNSEVDRLMNMEPVWELFEYESIVNKLFHLSNHFDVVQKIRPKNIMDLAICVAIKMPGKKYLINHDMNFIRDNIWKKESGIQFKKSHSIAYAHIIKIQLNSMIEKSI